LESPSNSRAKEKALVTPLASKATASHYPAIKPGGFMTYFLHFELCSLACFIKAHKSEKTATAVPEKALSRLLQKRRKAQFQAFLI